MRYNKNTLFAFCLIFLGQSVGSVLSNCVPLTRNYSGKGSFELKVSTILSEIIKYTLFWTKEDKAYSTDTSINWIILWMT